MHTWIPGVLLFGVWGDAFLQARLSIFITEQRWKSGCGDACGLLSLGALGPGPGSTPHHLLAPAHPWSVARISQAICTEESVGSASADHDHKSHTGSFTKVRKRKAIPRPLSRNLWGWEPRGHRRFRAPAVPGGGRFGRPQGRPVAGCLARGGTLPAQPCPRGPAGSSPCLAATPDRG